MTENTRSILVVDNDELVLNSITARLDRDGYRVRSVVSSRQALSVFHSEASDLIIADINMPGLDGIGLAEEIRRTSEVPVILITAYPEDYVERTSHLRGVELISKPFAWEKVAARIEAALTLTP